MLFLSHQRRFLLLALISIAISGFTVLCHSSPTGAASAGDWNASRIIDDVVFYDKSTMSVEQIQQFLNAKVPNCDRWGTQPYAGTTRRAYSEARGITFPLTCVKDYYENTTTHDNNLEGRPIPSGAKSAAQIIWEAAQNYNINPQVLIVLLQKEQALILDDWPWPIQYRSATGYGCPDTAPCATQYYGFYNQVENAAYQFRRYATYPNSYNYIPGRGNFIQYNPNASCGGATIGIENIATASLYNYTPYIPNQAALNNLYGTGDSCSAYGNRNFWRLFSDWFGSTRVSGKWLRQSTTTYQVWLVVEGLMPNGSYSRMKFRLTNPEVYVAYGIQYEPVVPVSEDYLSQYTDGGTLGTIATSLSYQQLQFFDNGRRFYLPDNTPCAKNPDGSTNSTTTWGLDCYNTNVTKTIPGSQFLERIPGAGPITPLMTNNNITYRMDGGSKLPIYDEQTLYDLGFTWANTRTYQNINANQPVGPLQLSHAAVVAFSGGPFLVYDNSTFKFHSAGNFETFSAWGLHKIANPTPASSTYNSSPPTIHSPDLSIWATNGTKKYLIDGGRKIDVTSVAADMPAGISWQTIGKGLLDTLPTASYGQYVWVRETGGVYLIENGTKRLVPNWENFVGLRLMIPQLLPISAYAVNQFPDGPPKLADGTLFQTSTGVHIVNGSNSYHVPVYQMFIDFATNVEGRIVGHESLNSAYPSSGELRTMVKSSAGTRFIVSGGKRWVVSNEIMSHWGMSDSFITVSDNNISRLPAGSPFGRFFLHNGGVYYAKDGAKHYVQSFNTFINLGGGNASLPVIEDDLFNAIPLGNPLP